ncbi:hypothetical protein BOW53_06045 [Solemya pervernicosa gill symbiont]|uniref:Glycosyl transferase n=1 Tax=Solemya pervernicosa gill symbiont TaxID=642797 RepID=A0A1T2L780_9GAMM|nr:glycosyltransferase family 4 protein [Solemya pervernicosa gill symbiont]OOZ40894.1 hypothetical protein BOW53_06045 [Solemya pervernicosa gill symbiont]
MFVVEVSSTARGSVRYIAGKLCQRFSRRGGVRCRLMAPVRGRFDLKVALRLLWNRREISLVHTHLGRASSLVGWLFKNSDVMTVATLHGMQKLRHYKNIKHFVAVSEAVRRHYVAQGLDDEKITIIPNGYEEMIDRYTGSGLRRELALPAGAPLIGAIGQLSPIKNQMLLLEVFRQLLGRGVDAYLLIVGEGEMRAGLEREIATHNMGGRVRLAGYRKDVAAIYSEIDILAATSVEEGFCLPVLEAMAFGVPVVATACGGPEDMIESGVNGYLAGVNDVAGLATALERLCGDTELRSRMGAHAKASVTGMEWGTIEQRYMSLFETLLAEQGEPPTVDRDD